MLKLIGISLGLFLLGYVIRAIFPNHLFGISCLCHICGFIGFCFVIGFATKYCIYGVAETKYLTVSGAGSPIQMEQLEQSGFTEIFGAAFSMDSLIDEIYAEVDKAMVVFNDDYGEEKETEEVSIKRNRRNKCSKRKY